MVDDAHGLGVLGALGGGTLEQAAWMPRRAHTDRHAGQGVWAASARSWPAMRH
jgi:hypothetical protein